MYSEEVDWCYRFRQAGWQTWFNPAAQAVHLWGGTSKQVRWEMFIELYRSRVRFFRRSYGAPSAFLLKLILGINCLVRIVPGALYYRAGGSAEQRQKHAAFRQLLAQLPGL
jgi:GT2 family glycosyltransferase